MLFVIDIKTFWIRSTKNAELNSLLYLPDSNKIRLFINSELFVPI